MLRILTRIGFGELSQRTSNLRPRNMAAFSVKSIDHVVLTSRDVPKTIHFYTKQLGMKHEVFNANGSERHALVFGHQKLNLHQFGKEFEPKAEHVQPGSEDLCFITDHPIDDVLKNWQSNGIEVLEGGKVVERTGAVGHLRSVYCRDPDGNLIE
ncbi:biphenyl-2,3-diol 1,2-dioxygenase [Stagonosporopsis vannaccii]|nr:biphenyl-2,3-diol 1,2-dioxygenase [Stagonosporopsis vannaccii]